MRASFPIAGIPLGLLLALGLTVPLRGATLPADAPILPLAEVRAGMQGEVWTVFQGTHPEPFTVEVTGVIRNALGPGKHIVLCRLTDPRVQDMGAVAGMSGSPLYINGRLAGALSYQLQRFETVHYAGFTPIEDLLEVSRLPGPPPDGDFAPIPPRSPETAGDSTSAGPAAKPAGASGSLEPLSPMFTVSGVDPGVAALFAPQFQALGLTINSLGGSWGQGAPEPNGRQPAAAGGPGGPTGSSAPAIMEPGDAISVALATGDITIAGTGTVSRVNGPHLLAFGHPLMRLGAVDLPMVSTEVVAILPSQLSSVKVANLGPVIGTISQDRLSAVYGEVGPIPPMIPVAVTFPEAGGRRTLRFAVARQPEVAPMITALGVAQGILGSNDAGLAAGFRLRREVTFPTGQTVSDDDLYAGPQGFAAGLGDFVRDLGEWLHNPFAKVFPTAVAFTVEPLERNPQAILDTVQLSRSSAAPGDTVQLTLGWRDYQGAGSVATVELAVPRSWADKDLEVVVANGPVLDELTGRPRSVPASQIRSFDEYLAALQGDRHTDGLYVAVIEKATVFLDQARPTIDYPASIERIARRADERRYQRREALVPLWEAHVLDGRLVPALVRRALRVND